MTLVLDTLSSLIPPRAKRTPSGWTSFNAPCCQHRGQNRDTRKRGGVIITDSFVYHCFNCGYATGWQPGHPISEKLRKLVLWLGGDDSTIKKLVFEALKTEATEYKAEEFEIKVQFAKKELPDGAMPINKWMDSIDIAGVAEMLEPVIAYLVDRGFDPLDKHFYWTPIDGYADRVIIPFWYEGKVVGSTARKVRDGRPKYLSDQHPHFVFNVDEQPEENKYILVCEGPFDALSVGGVALLTNEIGEQQARIINMLGKEVIIIPDQDKPGLTLIKQAMDRGWSVAFPNWEEDVKDAADAVRKYGKLFVIMDAIKTAQSGAIKINLAMKQLEHRLEIAEEK